MTTEYVAFQCYSDCLYVSFKLVYRVNFIFISIVILFHIYKYIFRTNPGVNLTIV